jgi:Glycoside hydrolase 123, N-terminal domain/Concanavalin A-like lectin/glucanases superfamily
MIRIISILFLLGLGFATYGDELSKNITFNLSFDKEFTPEIAKGSPESKFSGDKKLMKFIPGLGKELGLGLATGMACGIANQAVQFKAAGNLNPAKGTVVFWVQGLPGVKWNKHENYSLFQWNGKESIKISKEKSDKQFRLFSQGKSYLFPECNQNNWNFFAFTWNRAELKWYLNGKLCGAEKQAKPLSPSMSNRSFVIGQTGGGSDKENRIIDNLTIYDKPLTGMEVLSLYAMGTGMPTRQIIRISDTSEKIKIDGKMSPGEWLDASTALIGLDTKTKSIGETISRLYLTYDKKYLYFYLKSPIPTYALDDKQNVLLHGFFKRDTTVFDTNVDFDDALEFRIKTSKKKFWHRMLTNTIDIKYDYRFNKTRRELKWNPDWITKTSVSDNGWDLEGRIPFTVFPETPTAGAVWQMNVYRLWRKLKNQIDAWNNDNYLTFNPKGAKPGQLIFGGRDNVTVKVSSLTQLNNRGIDMKFNLINNGGKSKDILIEITNQDNTVIFKKSLTLSSGKSNSLKINKTFKSNQPTELKFSISDVARKQVYWFQEFPVFNIEGATFDLVVLPISKKLQFSGKFTQLGLDLKKTKIQVVLKMKSKIIMEKTIIPKQAKFKLEFDASKLKNGTYSMEVKLLEGDRVVVTKMVEYKKDKMPAWLGNKLGITKEVPPPWTPVKYQQDKITVWGRDYIYNNSLFPTQIDAVGDGLLAKPIKVDLKVSGKDILSNAKVTVQKLYADATQAIFLRTIKLQKLTVKVKTRIEFDGMMWNSLQLIPKAEKFKIDSLTLNIPLEKRNATLMMPHDYTLKNTGFTKKWHGSIRPVWIGNEERGLCFFTEHSYNWIVKDRQKELEIIPQKKDTMLRVNLIDLPTTISKPLNLEFGLMATPVKRMRKDHRKWRIHHFTKQITPEKNARFIQMPFRKWAKNPYYETCYPVADPNMRPVRGIRNRSKWEGLLYHQLKRTWSESPEGKLFGHEWSSELRVVPTVDDNPNNRQIEVCQASKSFQDFLVQGLTKIQREVNPGGFYFDVANPKKCYNRNHGCGYMVNGEIRPTFNILGAREMIKRIYIATKKVRPDSIIAYHVSGQVCLPVHSFSDLLFEGENFCSILNNNRGYQETLTLDTYRAEHMGHNFGPAVTLLPEFKVTNKWFQNTQYAKAKKIRVDRAAAAWLKRRKAGKETKAETAYWEELTGHINYLMGLSLLHDNPYWVAGMYNMQVARKHYRILGKFNYADGNNKYIPYWKQQIAKVVFPGKAVVSFYVSPKQAVAVVMNMSNKKMDVKLQLDVKKLGLSGKIKAVNLQYKNKVILKKGILTIKNMPAYQYRVVLLK